MLMKTEKGFERDVTMIEQITEIYENVKGIILPLLGSGIIACEITPIIKIKPVSMFLGWVGRKMNKDVKEKLNSVEVKVDSVQIDLQNHKVESWRRDILEFSELLYKNGGDVSKESYENIIEIHEIYKDYLKKNSISNGKVDLAYEHILLNYRKKRNVGGFNE